DLQCTTRNQTCLFYNSIVQAFLYLFIPSLFIIIFGCLIIVNIKKVDRRIVPASNSISHNRHRRTDRQFTRMLLAQVLLLTIFRLPINIRRVQSFITASMSKTETQLTIEAFLDQLLTLLAYISVTLPFYVFVLSGTIFRQILISSIRQIFHLVSWSPSPPQQTQRQLINIRYTST
ncbi:unnamed protein product, partial [Didymodactylos carnosus]